MDLATISRTMTCTGAPLSAVDVDLLAVPWFEEDGPEAVPGVDHASGDEISRALSAKEFGGRLYDTFLAGVGDRSWRARRLLLIGAGHRSALGGDVIRKTATTAALWARQRRVSSVGFVLRADLQGVDEGDLAQAIAEGLTLAEFEGGRYKSGEGPSLNAPQWTVAVAAGEEVASRVAARVTRGRVLGECSNCSRELANEPGNTLTPTEFARRASALATEVGVSVEILDETQIEKLGMGLLLGVARGSHEPPRLMVFRYEPPSAETTPVLGLVGKGITFDSGGISIKPADGMERMKDDMAGGSAVICAMRAIALLRAPIRVIGVVPTTENMPGGRAVKPGDVLTSASGKTVEVINTDAEGRLILGDGLWYARQLGATHLVDVATLTGACVVALGKITSGLYGAPDTWVEQVRRVANRAGDRVWPMPLFDEYRDQLKSEIADLTNTGGRPAGSITAALFLQEFSGGLPWAHLDIAGTAWIDESKPYVFLQRLTVAFVLDPFAQQQQPGIIVKIIETPHDPTGLSDAIIGAIGLTGAITLAALILGALVGGAMCFLRSRHPLQ
jgi:leucyl aminopeptidase